MFSLASLQSLFSSDSLAAIFPQYNAMMAQAQQSQVDELEEQARSDSASLMARYGTRLALGGASGSLASPAPR